MKKYADGGIFREGMEVPQDIDGASAGMGMRSKMPAEGPMMKREGRGAAKANMQRRAPSKVAPKKYAKGGSVSARADGIAKKGKTHCKMV
jgi:hypothetical protein